MNTQMVLVQFFSDLICHKTVNKNLFSECFSWGFRTFSVWFQSFLSVNCWHREFSSVIAIKAFGNSASDFIDAFLKSILNIVLQSDTSQMFEDNESACSILFWIISIRIEPMRSDLFQACDICKLHEKVNGLFAKGWFCTNIHFICKISILNDKIKIL